MRVAWLVSRAVANDECDDRSRHTRTRCAAPGGGKILVTAPPLSGLHPPLKWNTGGDAAKLSPLRHRLPKDPKNMLLRAVLTGIAIVVAGFAAPASAQNATFTDIRDAVPLRFFSAAQTAVEPGAPTTLVIGFEAGADSFRASAEVDNLTGTRLAADTLTFTVNAPPGHYVSSITCQLSGSGAVNAPGDARAAANWVVNGQPADLGSVGGAQFPAGGGSWSLSQTTELTDSKPTVVPVSLTTQLFAFAAPTGASAEVELTSATIIVNVAPVAATGALRE